VRRPDFEHVIAAAAEASGENEFIVIGSQAILGSFPDAPEALLQSQEADLYPRHDVDKIDLVEGALGDGSQFARTFGYFAHGVGPETATLPKGWEKRLVEVQIPPRVTSQARPVAFCLEPHDLVLSKCVAGRERDWQFARDALDAGLVKADTLFARAAELPVEPARRDHIRTQLASIIEQVGRSRPRQE
jgi:hypothetical protein